MEAPLAMPSEEATPVPLTAPLAVPLAVPLASLSTTKGVECACIERTCRGAARVSRAPVEDLVVHGGQQLEDINAAMLEL